MKSRGIFKRKAMALGVSAVMLAGSLLAGCTDSSVQDTASSQTETKAAGETGTAESGESGAGAADTLDVFINMSWYPVDTFTGICPEQIKKATGVDLNVTIATDANQLGVMIGSGEIPDLIFTDSETDRLSNAKLCYSYSELEEQFGANFDEVNEERKTIGRSLAADGEYYTILNNFNTNEEWAELKVGAPGQECVFYRKDLLEQLGNPKMETVEDLMQVLEQCKTTWPDKTPLGLGGVSKFQFLRNCMGVPANQYNTETGDYYYEASAPGYKEYLKAANEMARNGYVTAEAYANENDSDGRQAAFNGDCVFQSWYLTYNNLAQINAESKKIDPQMEWAIMPRLGDTVNLMASKGWAGAFVSRNCPNPEAAARLLSYLHSEKGRQASMWGEEGADYTLDSDGVPQFSDNYKKVRSDGQLDKTYNSWFYFGASAIDEIYQMNAGLDQEVLDVISTYGRNFENYPELAIAKPLSSSDEGVIFTKMEELKKSYEAKVIFAASDEAFESAFEEYMSALEKTGLSTYNAYMKDAIGEAKQMLSQNAG